MKHTLKLTLTLAATLMASNAFAEGDHPEKVEGGMAAQKDHMTMMDGNMMGKGMMKDGMMDKDMMDMMKDGMMDKDMMDMMRGGMMDKDMIDMMKKRAGMMSKCADEIEKVSPNPANLKFCAKMMRKQAHMMGTCMGKGCHMMNKGKNHHHENKKMPDKK